MLVHELSTRLRLKLHFLREPSLDFAYLEATLSAMPGIYTVRINSLAGSLVLEYNGKAEIKQNIMDWCANFSQTHWPRIDATENASNGTDLSGIIATAFALTLLPLLPFQFKTLLTYLTIAPTLSKGAALLLNQGIKVEVLDALAVGLAAIRGEYFTAMATHGLLTLGEYLEHETEKHSDILLRHLLKPMPSSAWVEREGTLIQMPSTSIKEGDFVVVGTGEMIPIDGRVIDGTAAVNEASLTGETVPVRKELKHKVLSGTVIEEGRLKIHATRVGDNTTTARITRFIEESLKKQSKTQRLAEGLANQRVYYTLGLGALVYLLTRDIHRLVAVFLVDHACPLKLGTPVAIKSAMYRGATHGMLFRGGQAIENIANADTIVFDKTGTLTTGHLEVTDIIPLTEETKWPPNEILALIASVEEHATHPVADAVVKSAQHKALQHIEHEEVDYMVAHGLTTQVEGEKLIIGSRHFLEEHQQISFVAHEALIKELEGDGKTVLYAALNQMPFSIIGLRDHLRPEAAQIVTQLKQSGIKKIALLTGDQRDKALALAEQLGIESRFVYYECPPEEKGNIVKELQNEGHLVAFVGDGVNDAPALISADVGIAMPKGADLARATADIVLLDDHLETVLNAKLLGNKTMQLIHYHFKVSMVLNSAVAGGAALGLLSPVLTALLHNGTTIGILLNSLAGVSLKETKLSEMKEKLGTVREALQLA
ncbi:MAG TPA: heavy metal translocating P-type ATPase [Thiotrichaceae bacterium]|nr:heavy metal translocating P-type ATPase [Thiotrichaceae bacterium]